MESKRDPGPQHHRGPMPVIQVENLQGNNFPKLSARVQKPGKLGLWVKRPNLALCLSLALRPSTTYGNIHISCCAPKGGNDGGRICA